MQNLISRWAMACVLAVSALSCPAVELTARQAEEDTALLLQALQTLHPRVRQFAPDFPLHSQLNQ